jgi:anti-sigma factor RsiW
MACDLGNEKLDAYLDGELPSEEANALSAHMHTCNSCAADALERVRWKRTVALAGKRYEPRVEFREKILKISAAKSAKNRSAINFKWMLAAAVLILILAVALKDFWGRETARQMRVYSELVDVHVATLASATPVDVVSTDRHTVKPWFQGRIPFSFNLPELQGTDFTLLGGRVVYLGQEPGAHLIYQIRKHEVSVFIFQDRGPDAGLPTSSANSFSFNTDTWTGNGLRYFVLGDVSPTDIRALSRLLQNAG